MEVLIQPRGLDGDRVGGQAQTAEHLGKADALPGDRADCAELYAVPLAGVPCWEAKNERPSGTLTLLTY